jgi:signal transduction histidine kinase
MAMRRIRTAVAAHPRLVDAVFAAMLAAPLAWLTADVGGTAGVDWMWLAALCLPLVWRRRWPVTGFWTIIVVAFSAVTVGVSGPALLVVPMVAGYGLGRHGPRRLLWTASGPAAGFAVGWLWHGGTPWDAASLIGLFAAAILVGSNIQTRRAYLAALEDRARRLERDRDQLARLTIATERARIAREMHDIVAHNLAVMVALADGAAATIPVAPERAAGMMETSASTGREALAEIRRLVGLLRDGRPDAEREDPGGIPAPQPGLDDIDDLVDQVRSAGLRVTVTREGPPGAWGPGAGLAVYRIVQEALTNTVRHAGPHATAEVRLRYHEDGADVDIVDDGGAGPAPAANDQPATGHGLTGMAERAQFYGGHVHAGPRPGGGWWVHATVPLAEAVGA